MELQPVGSGGRNRAARLRTWAAILLPVAVLAVVVGGGVIGGTTQGADTLPDRVAIEPPDAPRTTPDPSYTPRPRPRATPRPTPSQGPPGVPLPDEILGLDVHAVGQARAGPRLARPERLVAIGGWLTVVPGDPRCATTWYLACTQTGTISSARPPGGTTLRIETQPGVPLIGLQRQDPRTGTSSLPNRAILIGRFTRPLYRECGLQIPECEPVFTVERLAWIRQAERQRPIAFGPGAAGGTWTSEPAEAAARAALTDDTVQVGETLLLALVDRATLAGIDPRAASAATSDGPLWYLRAIVWRDTARGLEPGVGWAVLDDATRSLLAAGDLRDEPRELAAAIRG